MDDTFPGFCMSWSLLSFIDHINQTHIVRELNNAFLGNKGLQTLQNTAQEVLFKQFCGELPENDLTEQQLKMLFNQMLPCIIIRLVATQLTLVMLASVSITTPLNAVNENVSFNNAKTTIALANNNNVIFNAKHIWKKSCYLDLALDSELQFIVQPAKHAVKEYIFSVDTTRPFIENVAQNNQISNAP